eukprot:CAMPEP_0197689070 /NCGR_PEP_ID=MMETSP1338-20131121/106340_2 /TAXON_ID=43686 ORGANISM="Pelagodinium beii, Strain RCC1491" /NCGR_SAMPLE_ID=MMETSP1338 /ASSEMBLY_ACC=CAM_ASM_000754 /LENGTH=138 /DNA_ID=CAMNT_0043271373 /DNA_START=57 /DNA_END=470 /DNA_ORIENTATION=-
MAPALSNIAMHARLPDWDAAHKEVEPLRSHAFASQFPWSSSASTSDRFAKAASAERRNPRQQGTSALDLRKQRTLEELLLFAACQIAGNSTEDVLVSARCLMRKAHISQWPLFAEIERGSNPWLPCLLRLALNDTNSW